VVGPFFEHQIGDPRIIRLTRKQLNVDVLENEVVMDSGLDALGRVTRQFTPLLSVMDCCSGTPGVCSGSKGRRSAYGKKRKNDKARNLAPHAKWRQPYRGRGRGAIVRFSSGADRVIGHLFIDFIGDVSFIHLIGHCAFARFCIYSVRRSSLALRRQISRAYT
jgi:hypothetical protein